MSASSRRASGRSWPSTASSATGRRSRRGNCGSTRPRRSARAAAPATRSSSPAKPDESLLIRAVRHADGVEKMPPEGKLTDRRDRRPRRVGEGAAHRSRRREGRRRRPGRSTGRSSRRPTRPCPRSRTPPGRRPTSTASSWPKLEAKGLRPAPPADRRTLDPPGDVRPDRPAADAGGGRRVPRRTTRPTRSRGWSIGCSRRRPTASAGAGTGSTWPATPTPTAWTRTSPTATPGATATTSSPPSTRDKPYDQFVREQLAGDLLPAADAGRAPRAARSRPASSSLGPEGAGRGRRGEDGDGHRRRAGRHASAGRSWA